MPGVVGHELVAAGQARLRPQNPVSASLTEARPAKLGGSRQAPLAVAWDVHPLKGDLKDHYGLSVSGNWRMTFKFTGEDVEMVDYIDYH